MNACSEGEGACHDRRVCTHRLLDLRTVVHAAAMLSNHTCILGNPTNVSILLAVVSWLSLEEQM
jgi:hypothetical protein